MESFPATAKVMLISDDPEIARIWAFTLESQGLRTCLAELSESALDAWALELPDLMIVDSRAWQMEDIELCRKLRLETVVPLLLFTSQNDEYYLLEAYQAGVDEVVAQPVSPRLFIAKVLAWLRRAQSIPSAALDEVKAGAFSLDEMRRLLHLPGGGVLRLTHLEARLMYVLMSRPNRVHETPALVERVWGRYGQGDENLLKNLVYRLRKKIEPDPGAPRYLITESSGGYSFCTA
jgi:DNA-binding response OmpR family regulator